VLVVSGGAVVDWPPVALGAGLIVVAFGVVTDRCALAAGAPVGRPGAATIPGASAGAWVGAGSSGQRWAVGAIVVDRRCSQRLKPGTPVWRTGALDAASSTDLLTGLTRPKARPGAASSER
jgi:hypothetical protein